MSVKYSLNGKVFSDYGVFVSGNRGLIGPTKRRDPEVYNWDEYHGESVDLSTPTYEPREFSLDCFIVGDSWDLLLASFNSILSELSKPGTQRLLIEPFSYKALAYEVYMIGEVELTKTFKSGKMVGVFTLKLREPNPIKKVLKLSGTSLDLSYNSTKETEISYGDGTRSIVPGNASITGKILPVGSVIIIAGPIDEITNLTTNATILWERL